MKGFGSGFGYLASAFIGTLLGGVMVWLLWASSNEKSSEVNYIKTTQLPHLARNADDKELFRRMALLESQVSHLQMQLARRSSMNGDGDGDGGSVYQLSSEGVVDTDDLLWAVEDVIDEIEAERRKEKEVQKTKKRRAKAQELSLLFSSRLSLDAHQQQVLAEVLFYENERYAQLKNEERASRSSDVLTPKAKSEFRQRLLQQVEQETEAALTEILSDAQLSRFVEIRKEERLKPGD